VTDSGAPSTVTPVPLPPLARSDASTAFLADAGSLKSTNATPLLFPVALSNTTRQDTISP